MNSKELKNILIDLDPLNGLGLIIRVIFFEGSIIEHNLHFQMRFSVFDYIHLLIQILYEDKTFNA